MKLIYAIGLLLFSLSGSAYAGSTEVPCWAWDDISDYEEVNESVGIQYDAEFNEIGW